MKKLLGILLYTLSLCGSIQFEGPLPENFIIRWEFQNICDHAFDPVNNYGVCPASEGEPQDFDAHRVKPGDLIFVRDAVRFFEEKHPQIQVPYFILTHGEFRDKFREEFLTYLEDDKILAWFTIHPSAINHERVIPIPLGIVQYKGIYAQKDIVYELFMKHRKLAKKNLLYMNFTEWNMPYRTKIRKFFEDKPFCTYAERCDFTTFIHDLATHKFALSPPGLGPDCYRVWECLMVGTIPIVEHSHMDPLYKGLPVLFIDDWHEVTEEFLNEKYEEMCRLTYSQDKLSMEYWVDVIDAVRQKYWPVHAGIYSSLRYRIKNV